MTCDNCGKESDDVCERADGFRQDVHNEPDATWVACDACDHDNNMSI